MSERRFCKHTLEVYFELTRTPPSTQPKQQKSPVVRSPLGSGRNRPRPPLRSRPPPLSLSDPGLLSLSDLGPRWWRAAAAGGAVLLVAASP